jgi:hypothetical protein
MIFSFNKICGLSATKGLIVVNDQMVRETLEKKKKLFVCGYKVVWPMAGIEKTKLYYHCDEPNGSLM